MAFLMLSGDVDNKQKTLEPIGFHIPNRFWITIKNGGENIEIRRKAPQIVGFGIKDSETFKQATKTGKGAIIGSAFIKHLTERGVHTINEFVKSIR